MRQAEQGAALALLVAGLPLLLVVAGLVVDGALAVDRLVALQVATDAAARAATDAYDRALWEREHTVEILAPGARDLALRYLLANLAQAELVEARVGPGRPDEVTVVARSRVPLAFGRVLGLRYLEVGARSTAARR